MRIYPSFYYNYRMEESSMKQSLTTELKKIAQMERSVQEMQMHLKYLMKTEKEQQKKNQLVYQDSIKATTSRLNLLQTHLKSKDNHEKKAKQDAEKTCKVKEYRQKQNEMMRQTRLEISKLKELQRSEVQEISKKNVSMIKLNKINETERNRDRADKIKEEHRSKINDIKLLKEIEHKKRQERKQKQDLSRISKKPQLEEQMTNLRKEHKEIIERLKEKKQLQNNLKETVRKISVMGDEEILGEIKNSRVKPKDEPTSKSKIRREEQGQQIRKILIHDALMLHSPDTKRTEKDQDYNIKLIR